MTLKPGVKLSGIDGPAIVAAIVADQVYAAHGLEMVWTSALDGRHSATSLHYKGKAIDARLPSRCDPTPGRPAPTAFDLELDKRVTRDIQEQLGPEFDVVLETHQPERLNWHIHIEHDPK